LFRCFFREHERVALQKRGHRIHPSNTTTMRTIRTIGIAGSIFGLLFKTLHWPGASIILLTSGVLTFVMLALLLLCKPGPMIVKLHYPAMLIGALMAVITGGMFKIMHWPGANLLLLLGLTTCATWFLLPQGRRAVEA
jgi:hypothetical protein